MEILTKPGSLPNCINGITISATRSLDNDSQILIWFGKVPNAGTHVKSQAKLTVTTMAPQRLSTAKLTKMALMGWIGEQGLCSKDKP